MKHFISVSDNSAAELRHLIDVSHRLKKQLKTTGKNDPILANKALEMVFENPSLRPRDIFAVARTHLAGSGLLLRHEETGVGNREPIQDIARVISSMCDGI